MAYVTLEVPLSPLALVRCGQRRHAANAGIQSLRDPFDYPALSRRIAPFENHDHFELLAHYPVLELDQFALQTKQLPKMQPPIHPAFATPHRAIAADAISDIGKPVVVDLHL